jgi:RNA polymerase sigma factor (sigma-70 family)
MVSPRIRRLRGPEWPKTIERELERARAISVAVAAAQGNRQAAAEVVRLVQPAITRTVSEILGGHHPDLEDSIQQSLMALIDALRVFRGECHPAGYACRIAARIALRARRRARRLQRQRLELAQLDDAETIAPEDTGGQRRRALLCGLLAEIPEEQASALAQRVLLGLTLEEVAQQSGAPFNTVRSRIRMAREALQSRLRARPALLEELSQT